jgi:aminoglycoside phosphotransferase (APT) family kinase protein
MAESISKTKIDRAVAEAIVADAFAGEAELVHLDELTDGWFNAAYRLGLSDGRTVVLKIAPPPAVEVLTYERGIVHAEIEALRLVGERTDVPVPTVLWVDETCRHLPSPSYLMSFLPGIGLHTVRAGLAPDQAGEVDRTVGSWLRQVNSITGTSFGSLSPAMPRHDTWSAAFAHLLRSLLDDGRRRAVPLPIRYDDVEAALVAASAALAEVTVAHLVLWDLWDGNVMVDPDTLRPTGVLDLERAVWGDPVFEVQFGRTPGADFLQGYGADPLATPGARCRRALYTLYLHLVMSIEGTYRQYPADPIGDWARAQLSDDLTRCSELTATYDR